MSSQLLGYRITCDGCGVQFDFETVTGADPKSRPGMYGWDSASGVRGLAAEQGWIATTSMNAWGHWTRIVFERFGTVRKHSAGIFDACPACAPGWVPPMPNHIAAAVNRAAAMQDAQAAAVTRSQDLASVIAELAAENARLRAERAQS